MRIFFGCFIWVFSEYVDFILDKSVVTLLDGPETVTVTLLDDRKANETVEVIQLTLVERNPSKIEGEYLLGEVKIFIKDINGRQCKYI